MRRLGCCCASFCAALGTDLLTILAAFGKKCPQQVSCEVDVETKRSKGEINVEDLLAVLAAFGQKCGN